MQLAPRWVRMLVRILGTLFPRPTTSIVYRMFWSLGRPMALRANAEALHARATREELAVGARTAIVYRWGSGAQTVLLVHGWRGRGSQFSALVEALESPERTIVTFDAPGNGSAPGRRTDVRDYIAVINDVARAAGGLELLVAHSFGAIAAFVAVREGVRTERLVSIAGIATMNYTFDTFARALDLPEGVRARLRIAVERRVFAGDAGIWRRFTSRLDPADGTPLLVVHDRNDRAIEFSESDRIAEANPGRTSRVSTSGLGHNRVLADPAVLEHIVAFATEPAQTRSEAR